MTSKHPFITSLLLLVLLLLSYTSRALPNSDRFMGTGSCSSSNCHGSVHPLKGTSVSQNEYFVWLKHDPHSQAYTNLLKPEGKRMSSLMGLGEPSQEPLCLKCHSTYVPDASRRGEKFTTEDGVSCESCHGASERWLSTHTVAGVKHSDNLGNGLADTVTLDKRATLCLSCHYGDSDKRVTHDLYGAGHPRLSFELDTFGILQPKHWVIDDDYVQRKSPYVPLVAWFTGQAKAAQATLDTLRSSSLSKNGLFPELSLFDCYSCHHSLTENQWKQRTYQNQPGRLKLNLPSLLVLQAAVTALDPGLGAELSRHSANLHAQYQKDGATESLAALDDIVSKQIIPMARALPVNDKTNSLILKALATSGSRTPFPTYETAEQIAMGIQAVLATSPSLGKTHGAHVKKIFAAMPKPKSFNPAGFTKASAELMNAIR